jgi:hypothetical protein
MKHWCDSCAEHHKDGHTHHVAVLYDHGIYLCERCALAGYGSIAHKDGTLCKRCIDDPSR